MDGSSTILLNTHRQEVGILESLKRNLVVPRKELMGYRGNGSREVRAPPCGYAHSSQCSPHSAQTRLSAAKRDCSSFDSMGFYNSPNRR